MGTLGARAAVAWGGRPLPGSPRSNLPRWPLTQHKPRPTPKVSVTVRRAAVLTARYEAVVGWGKLDDAEKEAAEIAAMFSAASDGGPSRLSTT